MKFTLTVEINDSDIIDSMEDNCLTKEEIKQQIDKKHRVWQNSDAFSWVHPSDRAYEIMFDALQDKLRDIAS